MTQDERFAAVERELDSLSERLDLTRVALGIVLGMVLDPPSLPPKPTIPVKSKVFQ